MLLSLFVTVLLWNLTNLNVLNYVASSTHWIHTLCQTYAPLSEFREFYSAIVCGSSLTSPKASLLLRKSGLLHLIVVSGSHLVFLSILLYHLAPKKTPHWFKHLMLGFYVLVTGLQPPVLRAFITQSLFSLNNRFKLFTGGHQIIWSAGLVCILLSPTILVSYSFLLSWGASLALCLTHQQNGVTKHMNIYFVMLPLLLPLAAPHPISILFNSVMAPFLAFLLFPMSLLSFVLPFLTIITDPIWEFLFKTLETTTQSFTFFPQFAVHKKWLWIYVWTLNIWGIYKNRSFI